MKKIKIFLADDHNLFREGLRRLLETEKDFDVADGFDSGEALRDYIFSNKHSRDLSGSIILLDINIPGINGIQLTRMVKEKFPEIKILILSMYEDESHILQAFNAGCDGYTIKTMPSSEIINAIKQIAAGRTIVPRSLTPKLVSGLCKVSGEEVKKRLFGLTPKEIEIIAYLAEGLANKEIAFNLKTKTKTVKNQMNN
ncbi:response regulator transcription factor, partial [bacterium]|nr:response regulator transcription factor [bacterium]MBU3954988.1 response regulator transcription factor [bacterium]